MEAIASGALIFVDHMYVPRQYPLLADAHVVFYDNNNKTDIFEKLDYYRAHADQGRRVAVSGYLHSMKYHRAANLLDYVFRTIDMKLSQPGVGARGAAGAKGGFEGTALAALKKEQQPYTETGYHMRQKAVDAEAARVALQKKKQKQSVLV